VGDGELDILYNLSPGIEVELGRGVAPIKGLSTSDLLSSKCETSGGGAVDRFCELCTNGSDGWRVDACDEGRVGVETGVAALSE
jgi:hypothetical protein